MPLVLVADGSFQTVDIVESAIATWWPDARFEEAYDGWEAIQISDRHPAHIDLVVTDVVMPNVKGTELAEHIARTRPDSLILFISGYTDNLPVQVHLDGGGAEFLAKPFTPQHLRTRVQSLLDTAVPQPTEQARRA